jgi:hypothetical protein
MSSRALRRLQEQLQQQQLQQPSSGPLGGDVDQEVEEEEELVRAPPPKKSAFMAVRWRIISLLILSIAF